MNFNLPCQLEISLSGIDISSFLFADKEILSVYYKVEELNDDLLANSKSEISDEIVIWLWEIMVLRKKQIDNYNNGK